jgi:hypothetical protein
MSAEFLTRRQLLDFLHENRIPIGKSTLSKRAMVGLGPPVAAWWGRRALYRPEEALQWAKSLLTASPGRVHPLPIRHPHEKRTQPL